MMDRIRTVVWYGVLLTILYILYYIASTYGIALVDENYTYMEPTLKPHDARALNRSRSAIRSLQTDDLIAFEYFDGRNTQRLFGRVLATPGTLVTARDKRLLVDGFEAADLPSNLSVLDTGLIIPQETVFVVFDSTKVNLPLSRRLVPYRSILGRVTRK